MPMPSKKDLFGSVRLDELTKPHNPGQNNQLVAFSARLTFGTFQRLKQAQHALGFLEQDFVNAAISAALDELPESSMPLPLGKQAQLLEKLKPRRS